MKSGGSLAFRERKEPVYVTILDTYTSERRVFTELAWFTFLWSDGNYSCDCNRALFFADANGEARPSDPPCDVDDRRYLITEVTDVAGNLLYWEAP